ncbi:MAG TPA: FtsX-like permease family protein [Ignavibacteriaceae bacterium]|nr:FtsX-like permease family protein [Ignavibacteriaceae bacterium]
MFKSYLTIALRNIRRFKVFSVINIAGLSFSLAVVILIAAFMQNELSIDKFHANYSKIYKISKGTTPVQIGEIIKSKIPEIKSLARVDIISSPSVTIKYNEKILSFQNAIYTEPDFFNIFSFKPLQGDIKSALETPLSIILIKSEARRIFGDENPLGKSIKVNNEFELTVKAVIEDIPQNSSIQFNGAISLETLKIRNGKNNDPFDWQHWNYCTYVLFPDKVNHAEVINKINNILKLNIPEQAKDINVEVIPFKQLYYDPNNFGIQKKGSTEKNFALISIALLILIIAIINYMNLTTARAAMRVKEIGVRKTVGASKLFLIYQFLSESVFITIISMITALLIASTLLPAFNELVGSQLQLFPDSIFTRCVVLSLAAVILGILSGVYPAFYITSFKPDSVLRGAVSSGKSKMVLWKGLIILQFTIAVTLIISTIVIYRQMEFINDKHLGFQKDNIIYFPTNNQILSNKDAFENEILNQSYIEDFAYSFDVPGKMSMKWGNNLKYEGKETRIWYTAVFSTYDFMRIMNLKIIAGRNFYNDTTDYGSIIINEAFAKTYNLKKPLEASLADNLKVVGVVKDFNYQSLRSKVEPLAFLNYPLITNALVKLKSTKYKDIKSVINHLESVWKKYSPDFPFEYNFLDESLASQYKAEERFEKAFISFSLLAVIISCLGLFGLISFTTEQKTKEIGIRKVLGASISGICTMLSRQFIILVLISIIIASPLAYYTSSKWLQNFAYRIEISWWMFVLAGGVALLIAIATVSFQAIKAATANPVESLRYE